MLTELRKNAKRVLWPLTIIIIIGMGGWGAWEGVRNIRRREETRVGSFRGRIISIDELREAYFASQLLSHMLGFSPEQDDLEQMAWERIVMNEEAKEWGIEVTRPELADFIRNIPVFRDERGFNSNLYRSILRNLQISESYFEEQMRQLVAIERLRGVVMNTAHVTPAEVEEYYRRATEKVRVDYVLFDREDFFPEVSLSEDEIRAFHRDSSGRYQVPEQARVEYILVGRDDLPEEKAITEEDIDDYIRRRDGDGDEPDPEPAREEAWRALERRRVEELADEINRFLAGRENLNAAVERYSLTLHRPEPFARWEPVGGLGLVEEVSRLAFESPEGDISHPIEVEERFCFFQVVERRPARIMSLEEAREQVEEDARRQRADRKALEAARDRRDRIRSLKGDEDLGFQEAAAKLDLEVLASPLFSQREAEKIAAEVGSNELPAVASLTPKGKISQVFRAFDGYGFLQVAETVPPEPLSEEDRSEWREEARQFKSQLVFRDWFTKVLAELRTAERAPAAPQPAAGTF